MYDLSAFMKTLKQRFARWYNRRKGVTGTMWEERFKSVLLEPPASRNPVANRQHALSMIAAYIDLNAVRAGIVKDPKDYRWCGYGEAVSGSREMREGIRFILQTFGCKGSWAELAAAYRQYLFCIGEESGRTDELGQALKQGIDKAKVAKVLKKGGKLSRPELLQCRVRYFTDGMVLGSREFVDEVFNKNRERFSEKRTTGARPMRWGQWDGLCSARELRKNVVTVSAG